MEQSMKNGKMGRTLVISGAVLIALGATSCSDGKSPEPAGPCDQQCQDGVALRAVREVMKYVFNRRLWGNEAGAQDETSRCETNAGSAHIFGDAVSNTQQGSTEVKLTYEFYSCRALRTEATPSLNYNLSLRGTITEVGTLSAQSTSTMALELATVGGGADAGADGSADDGADGSAESAVDGGLFSRMSFVGTVYDPPIDYNETGCEVVAVQNGNNVTGTVCGRPTGFSF
jgi:hypothetical protein